MRKVLVTLFLAAALGAGVWLYVSPGGAPTSAAGVNAGGGAPSGRGMGRGGRAPMTVELAPVSRRPLTDYVTVVGNLIGLATVDVVPRVGGRLESISVRLGDRVSRGQTVVKVEDREIREQINQVTASLDVNRANVVNRENDLKVAELAFERARTSFERGIASRQSLEDAEARYNAAVSQLTVAKAQQAQTTARIDELKITLSNTSVQSPVDGFVSRRNLDPGAFANANTVILSVVDISTVRLIVNVVERDFRRVAPGVAAEVEVDAFPGEKFAGAVSRVAPVFDPATRTATIEIEVPNPGYRLKPGMYARVRLTVEEKPDALTVPRNAVVDQNGVRGVFLTMEGTARFQPVTTGIQDDAHIEIIEGLTDGQRVVTTGALALREGDQVVLLPEDGGRGATDGRSGRGGREGGSTPPPGRL
jgi:RND family efflux transporter MFP subunit